MDACRWFKEHRAGYVGYEEADMGKVEPSAEVQQMEALREAEQSIDTIASDCGALYHALRGKGLPDEVVGSLTAVWFSAMTAQATTTNMLEAMQSLTGEEGEDND